MKLLLVLLAGALVTPQTARDPVPPAGTATVSGVVYFGERGEAPARRARVSLQSSTGLATGRTTITDDEGRFEFTGVAGDRFNVQATREGWLQAQLGASRPGRPGRPVVVENGGRVSGLVLRMFRASSLSGTVRDGAGRPAPNVRVTVLRIGYSYTGQRQYQWSPGADTLTDDRGKYRAWGLTPGSYVVVALPAIGSESGFERQTTTEIDALLDRIKAGRQVPPAVLQTRGRPMSFGPVFHPGTTDLAHAGRIDLGLEDERENVDVTVSLVPSADVAGTIQASGNTLKPTRVLLQPIGEMALLPRGVGGVGDREAFVEPDGRFEFRSIRPGNYRLLTRTSDFDDVRGVPIPMMYGSAELRVDAGDVAIVLTLQPAITVTGRVTFNGSQTPPKDMTGLSVNLLPAGTQDLGAGRTGDTQPDGRFAIGGVIPGSHRVVFLSRVSKNYGAWVLANATLNGRDALDGPVEIAGDATNELVLTYTDRPSGIRGTLTVSEGQAASEYFIVVLPASRSLWQPGSRRIRNLRAAQDGSYEVLALPPGDYLIAALTDLDPADLYDNAFLETLAASAARITLAEGQTLVQNLKIG